MRTTLPEITKNSREKGDDISDSNNSNDIRNASSSSNSDGNVSGSNIIATNNN